MRLADARETLYTGALIFLNHVFFIVKRKSTFKLVGL